MAEIFLARPISSIANGRLLIIKRILSHASDDTNFRRMFRSEIQVCMGLTHPNIVQLYDFGEFNNRPFIAMEYVEGRHFRQVINEFTRHGDGFVPIELAVSLIAQTAAGLHYAHKYKSKTSGESLEIIHRDVSPQNLIVSYDGNVKIIDFGIAKSMENNDKTQTGIIKGKVSYLSPEQISGVDVDARSDVFAAGLVLWELLTSKKLFNADGPHSELNVLKMIQSCEKHLIPPSIENPRVPRPLDDIVMKALAKAPEDRYATALDFQKDLRSFLLAYKPGYGYSDVGHCLQETFRDIREADDKRNRELNDDAQGYLDDADPTRVTGSSTTPPPFDPAKMVANSPIPSRPPALGRPIQPIQSRVLDARTWSIHPVHTQTEQRGVPIWRKRFPMATFTLMFLAVLLDRKYLLFDWVFQAPQYIREVGPRKSQKTWAIMAPETPVAVFKPVTGAGKRGTAARGLSGGKNSKKNRPSGRGSHSR